MIPLTQLRRLRSASNDVDTATAELYEAVRDAKEHGGSIRAIASELGRSTQTIQRWLRERP